MEKAQLVYQKIHMTLKDTGKNSNFFPALELKGKTSSKDEKIGDKSVEVRAQFFYSARRPFRKLQCPS